MSEGTTRDLSAGGVDVDSQETVDEKCYKGHTQRVEAKPPVPRPKNPVALCKTRSTTY